MIAQDRLDSAATARMQQILGQGITLDQIASCADQMRASSVNCANAFPLAQNKASSPWHFINIPITDSPSPAALETYCQGGNCVVDAIRNNLQVLQDAQATRQQQQIALMFLVHFVGDEHQPLHCAEEIDANGKSDYGGNAKPVVVSASDPNPNPAFPSRRRRTSSPASLSEGDSGVFAQADGAPTDLVCSPNNADYDDDAADVEALAASKRQAPSHPSVPPAATRYPLNLHHYWDNIIETDSNEASIDPRTLATHLEQDLNRRNVSSWLRGDFVTDAALESFQIAKDQIYPEYHADLGQVGPSYSNAMQPIAIERIEMAGVRLAALLEKALGNNGQPPIAHRPTRRPTTKPTPSKPSRRLETAFATF